ncbi:DNA-binding NarL/FixJ family response regulator [Bradyrhizobium sp. LM2.7]
MQDARTIPRPIIGRDGRRETDAARAFVHVLADSSEKLSGVCSILERNFAIAGERLDAEAKLSQVPFAVVIRADLRDVDNIAAIKKRAAKLAKAQKRIFLVEYASHVSISQAYALGATLVLPGRVDRIKLLAALTDPAALATAAPSDRQQPDNAVETAATAIASMFTAVTLGEPSTLTVRQRPAARSPIISSSAVCPNGSPRSGATTREPTSIACS